MYSGVLNYQNISYHFIIKANELIMDPLEEGSISVYTCFTEGNVLKEDFFVGCLTPSGADVIMIPRGNRFSCSNYTIKVPLLCIIEFIDQITPISGIQLNGDELNCIYDIRKSIHEWSPSLEHGVSIKIASKIPFDDGNVTFKDNKIFCKFLIGYILKYGIEEAPISLYSVLELSFQETNDYYFLIDIIGYCKKTISFLCNRRNTNITNIKLINKDARECAKIILYCDDFKKENSDIIKNRYIPYEKIRGNFHKVLQDIIDKKLYTLHIPESHHQSITITPASFLMDMAAFENEFKRLYPSGLKHSPNSEKAHKDAKEKINSLITNSSGKEKNIYQFLYKLINSDSLGEKLKIVLDDFSDIINPFGNYLYEINNMDYDIPAIAERINNQRNAFAHGNLSKPFYNCYIVDITLVKLLVYAMQLKHYNISDDDIRNIIKKLFDMNSLK